jgi:hypothetical protein
MLLGGGLHGIHLGKTRNKASESIKYSDTHSLHMKFKSKNDHASWNCKAILKIKRETMIVPWPLNFSAKKLDSDHNLFRETQISKYSVI